MPKQSQQLVPLIIGITLSWLTVAAWAEGSEALLQAAERPAEESTARGPVDTGLDASLGTLVHDGPATPEQISLYLPIIGNGSSALSANVRYADRGKWLRAHPLFRIRPEFAAKGSKATDAFAGVITGLEPGKQYDIEVTVTSSDGISTRNLTAATRTLSLAAPAANTTIRPGTSGKEIQALLDQAVAGDVIQFQNGIYRIDELVLRRSGTKEQPIYIRGESRDGVKLIDGTGRILHVVKASHLVIENLTLEGSGIDSGTNSTSTAIQIWNGHASEEITVRNLKITGVDKGIIGTGEMRGFLIHDNTLIGNNTFEKASLESKSSWNDDGIRVPGRGHAVFNNTLSGFGDALAMSSHAENVGIHFYRNRIIFTGDDAFEGDFGTRNLTFYDNRVQNSMTLVSFDPVYGGPAFVFRNVAINVGRSPYKLNNKNSGLFFYNNTVVRMPGYGAAGKWGWVQPSNGALRAWGYRNNILLFSGSRPMVIESLGNDPIDFTHNAWFPDGRFFWTRTGGSFSSLSGAWSRLPETTPVFSDSQRRHDHDVIAEANPFETEIRFNSSYDQAVMTLYEPVLSSASRLKNAGVAIPGITDGFSGKNPDIGAIIGGRPRVQAGDRTQ